MTNAIGDRFGNWTVIAHAGTREKGSGKNRRTETRWKVRCTCGHEKVMGGHHLVIARSGQFCLKCRPAGSWRKFIDPWPTSDIEILRQKVICEGLRPR